MNLLNDMHKCKQIDSYTDDRYGIKVFVFKGVNNAGHPVEVSCFTKGDLSADVSDNMKYSANGRSNAKVVFSDGRVSTFSHVSNAKCAAMKFVNGGTWDFATR